MAEWIRVCSVAEAPLPGEVTEREAGGKTLCLANLDVVFSVLDNVCPHRAGPLGQGWIEGKAVLCPWHAWAFDLETGIAEPPEQARVAVFPVRIEGGALQVCLDGNVEA